MRPVLGSVWPAPKEKNAPAFSPHDAQTFDLWICIETTLSGTQNALRIHVLGGTCCRKQCLFTSKEAVCGWV